MQPNFTYQIDELNTTFGRFVIEPLPQGFGHTLGNSLRRVLYTSIPGAAITSVKISGVNHQFTTISGVKEDVVQLILLLKQIRLAYTGDKPTTIKLSSDKKTEITAGDFQTPAGVTVSNPDLVIAHLADKSVKFEIEATVEAGFGYSPAEDRKGSTVGVIPTDAIFTPVIKANYFVDATRVGRVTNFDKLTVEITTDGTVSPQSALTTAAQTLVTYFQNIVSPSTDSTSVKTTSSSQSHQSSAPSSGSSVTIEELDLPTRITNALQKAGFDSISSLLVVPRAELAKVKNLGAKSVKIIEAALKERGIEMTI
jgi:DNA-directed RNA polymerase subunit alpha